jgi:hypothetical protein
MMVVRPSSATATIFLPEQIASGIGFGRIASWPTGEDVGNGQPMTVFARRESATNDMRSNARLAFLYPARVVYADPIPAWQHSALGAAPTAQETTLDVVMTDFSVDGAGILVSARHVPLPRRISLIVDGSAFTCQVRWTNHVGGSVYRYGLAFRAVRAASPPHAAADAAKSFA